MPFDACCTCLSSDPWKALVIPLVSACCCCCDIVVVCEE